jgi:hypothetical protein
MRIRVGLVVGIVSGLVLLTPGCMKAETPAGKAGTPKPATASGPCPTILLAQAQFVETAGQPVPASRLVILRQVGDEWTSETIEDPESNVFHKAIIFENPDNAGAAPGILTIGANAAAVKLWRQTVGKWTAETLWTTTFGGKQNRLRDFEIGDVTGDGKLDFVIVTHDQGVVVVLCQGDTGWEATEIDREKDIWIHECELGDLDGDGSLEIYATPSNPNKFDGKEQPGKITVYRHTVEGFERGVVEEFPLRHVKEILVTQLDGSGPVLLASVEAELGERADAPPDASKTLIKRYRFENGKYVGDVVCTLPDSLCRFLNAGDIDGDGMPELIASTHTKGVWLVRPAQGEWQPELIDADAPKQFEHATVLADLDEDGMQEIYVVNDSYEDPTTEKDVPGRVSRYRWTEDGWQRTTLSTIEGKTITFGISAGKR